MKKLLELENVSFSYSNGKPGPGSKKFFSLKNISFDIEENDFVSIIGKNGSGKSTIVKLISKILVGYSGKIYYREKEIQKIERKEYAKNVSYLPQSLEALGGNLFVKEFLLLGRYAHKNFSDFTYSDEDRKIVEESIEETSISHLAGKHLDELSGGEKQKVLITLALVQLDITKNLDGKILIIDEPLTHLDVNHQFEIFDILKRLKEKNLSIIIVIHDLNLALRFSDKTILMNDGIMIKYAGSKEVITEEMLKEHFRIDSKILNFEKNYFINYLPN
jgi:ABC-type cobalamin/Fe3+-siderophores transport system ATPase subunit